MTKLFLNKQTEAFFSFESSGNRCLPITSTLVLKGMLAVPGIGDNGVKEFSEKVPVSWLSCTG